MNTTSRTITGGLMVVIGIGLLGVPLFAGKPGFVAWFYGIPILIIGAFILFNKKEDVVEQRKDERGSKK